MTAEPTISVIIPARNEESVIASCVRSAAAQSEVLEIVVVNDQSTDRTAEIGFLPNKLSKPGTKKRSFHSSTAVSHGNFPTPTSTIPNLLKPRRTVNFS